ncbi:hypothetical protein [Luteolibacter sp. Populi]|uniref:hypothetical protein n=1 Tax=Luteolibacter sp. Populi TaxID=3230487 RepID=UPI003466030A
MSTLVPLGVILALSAPSCSYYAADGYQAAGYSPRDAYYRGHTDGSGDKYRGLAYDPHINEDRTLPSAHRNDYMWGYVDGFRNPGGYGGSK